jgi:hypothetical protein
MSRLPRREQPRTCPVCKVSFRRCDSDTGVRWKYCSAECNKAAQRQALDRWQQRNPGHWKPYRERHRDGFLARDREAHRRCYQRKKARAQQQREEQR